MKKFLLAALASSFCLSALADPVPAEYDYASATGSCSNPSYTEDFSHSFIKYAANASSMSICYKNNGHAPQCNDVAMQGNTFHLSDPSENVSGTISLSNSDNTLTMHSVDNFTPYSKSSFLKKRVLSLASKDAVWIVCTYDTVYNKK